MSANILQACIDGVHYWRSPYNPESVQAHSGLHGSLLTKKAVTGFPVTVRSLNIY